MYGDMRHIFVMQSEMENEIDDGDLKYSADKYSKAFNSHNAQREMRAKKEAERKNFRSDSEPYFRPAQRPSATNSKQKTKPPRVVASEQQSQNNDVLPDNTIKSNVDAIVGDSKKKDDNFTSTSPAVSQKTTKLTSVPSSSTTPSSTSDAPDDLVSESVGKIASKKNDEATTVDKVALNLFNNISSALSSSTAATSTSSSTSATISDDEDSKEELSSTSKDESIVSNTLGTVEEEIEAEALNDLEQIAASVGETIAETDAIDRNNSKEPQTTTTETQLFQDTVHKEKDPAPVANRRGV